MEIKEIKEINYVCSLGSLCHSAFLLKRNNLKVESFPFDWIFSDPDMVIQCVVNEFNIFLDKSYYTITSEIQRGHVLYGSNIFFHHNPLKNEDDYNYYLRCVDRFNILLKKTEPKLFVMIFINNDHGSRLEKFKNSIIEFNNKFKKYTENYNLLVIIQFPTTDNNHHSFTYIDNIHFLDLYTSSNSNGILFLKKNDNQYLDNIIKNTYKFNIKKL